MLLAIDIGNTDIVIGLFKGGRLKHQWRIGTHLRKTADEYGLLVKQFLNGDQLSVAGISAVIISSVVPPLTPIFQEMVKRYFQLNAMVVTEKLKTGLVFRTENPKEIGADRIVNATAAFSLYGGPIVVVDLGTATTFCVVSGEGEYLGGAIAPGFLLSVDALVNRTAKLPRIEYHKPENVIGKNTVSSMQAGVFFGYTGLINEIVTRIQDEIGSKTPVIATGGLSGLFASECRIISNVHPTLTLEGLMIIYKKNRGARRSGA